MVIFGFRRLNNVRSADTLHLNPHSGISMAAQLTKKVLSGGKTINKIVGGKKKFTLYTGKKSALN